MIFKLLIERVMFSFKLNLLKLIKLFWFEGKPISKNVKLLIMKNLDPVPFESPLNYMKETSEKE